jgi:hypothetical protein
MKCLVILVSILFSLPSLARSDRQILKCLGQEEKRFHLKKQMGPVYDLNQRLISEMVQIPGIEINPEDYLAICTGSKFSESWKLLERSIIKGKDLFVIDNKIQGMQRAVTTGMIEDFVDATNEILLKFISEIQTLSPTPDCLKNEIPELDNFFTEIKYLQEDLDLQTIFKGKDMKIFEKLKNYPLAFEKCRARLKKKARPVSTRPAKKS